MKKRFLLAFLPVLAFFSFSSSNIEKANALEDYNLTIEVGSARTFNIINNGYGTGSVMPTDGFNDINYFDISKTDNVIYVTEQAKTKYQDICFLPFEVKITVPMGVTMNFDINLSCSFRKNASAGTAPAGAEIFDTNNINELTSFNIASKNPSAGTHSLANNFLGDTTATYNCSGSSSRYADNSNSFVNRTFSYGFSLFTYVGWASSYDHQLETTCTVSIGNVVINKTDPTFEMPATAVSTSLSDIGDPSKYFSFTYYTESKEAGTIYNIDQITPNEHMMQGDGMFECSIVDNSLHFIETEPNKHENAIFVPLVLNYDVPAYTKYTISYTFDFELSKHASGGTAMCGLDLYDTYDFSSFSYFSATGVAPNNAHRIYRNTTTLSSSLVKTSSSEFEAVFDNSDNPNNVVFTKEFGVFAFVTYASTYDHTLEANVKIGFKNIVSKSRIILSSDIGGLSNKSINVTAGSALTDIDVSDIKAVPGITFNGYRTEKNGGTYIFNENGEVVNNFIYNLTKPLILYADYSLSDVNLDAFMNLNTSSSLVVKYTENEGNYSVSRVDIRFGVVFDKDTYDSYANIEYGIAVSLGSDWNEAEAKYKVCSNFGEENNLNSFYLLLENVPSGSFGQVMSARAYVKVSGIYYYANVKTCSVKSLANEYLTDYSTDPGVIANSGVLAYLAN